MPVEAQSINGTQIIAIVGELDATTTPRLITAIREGRAPRLVLDLTELTFMDSSGLGAILYAWTSAGERGGRLILVCPLDAHVRHTLNVRGVADRITVVETRQEALTVPLEDTPSQ